ncbi:nose resistant to fluoxetine protein 6 [Trichonephila clavipes]|nr:nose resistant to fluoxetine protein 6 [Trichonephila clavipes]
MRSRTTTTKVARSIKCCRVFCVRDSYGVVRTTTRVMSYQTTAAQENQRPCSEKTKVYKCLDHTWVFAVDAQLHIMSVFILIPLKMRPKVGLAVNLVLAVASLVSVALTNVYYDLPPNEALAFLHVKDRYFYAEHSYYRMYSHIGFYCTGIFVAYLVHIYPTMKISKKTSGFLWLITLLCFWASTCSVHTWRTGIMPSSLLSAVYVTLSKVALGALLAWISVACMTGQATGLKDVLSWRPFAFLAKLFFIAYIMHVPIINMVMSYKREHFFITDLELFYVVLNHVSGTLIVSYILYVYLEAPFLSLADVLTVTCIIPKVTKGAICHDKIPGPRSGTAHAVQIHRYQHLILIIWRIQILMQWARIHCCHPCSFPRCSSPVVKVSDHDRHVMSSSPVPLKTRRVGQRCTLNLSRAETPSHWWGGVVRRGGTSSNALLVT